MSTLNHIKELTAGECPDWVCEQIAEYLDERDARLAAMTAERDSFRDAWNKGEWPITFKEEVADKLAASQAREQQLRGALKRISMVLNRMADELEGK